MSMSLDGYVADPNDGVAEVFNWYVASGDVEFHTVNRLAGTPAVLGTPTVIPGVGVTHVRYAVHKA